LWEPILTHHSLLLCYHVLVAWRRYCRVRAEVLVTVQVLHLHLKVFFQKDARFDEVMVMQVSALVVLEVISRVAAQELESKQALIRLLLATVEELLGAVSCVEGLFIFTNNSETVLKRCILDLLRDLLVVCRCNQLKQRHVPRVPELWDSVRAHW